MVGLRRAQVLCDVQRAAKAEQEVKEEMIRRQEAAMKDAEELRFDKQKLLENQEVEAKSKQELGQKYVQVTEDMVRMQRDLAQLQEHVQTEATARKRVEQEKQQEIQMREDLAQRRRGRIEELEGELGSCENDRRRTYLELSRTHQQLVESQDLKGLISALSGHMAASHLFR